MEETTWEHELEVRVKYPNVLTYLVCLSNFEDNFFSSGGGYKVTK